MRARSPIRLGILGLGIAWALSAEWIRLANGWSESWVLTDLIPGIGLLIGGWLAWDRRPDSRVGMLMMAAGFAWYVGTFTASPVAIITRPAAALQGFFDAFLAWVVLAYPNGRLRGWASRAAIGAFFAVLLARAAFRFATVRLSTDYDFTDPTAVDRYITDVTLRDTGEAVFRLAIAIVAFVVLVLLVLRLRSETKVGRRIAGPMVLGGIALAAGVVTDFGIVSSATTTQARFASWDSVQLVVSATGILLAILLVAGLIRGRLSRGSVADLVLELGRGPERPALQDVLARALRDPTLQVAYPVAGSDRFVDAEGQALELPPPTSDIRAMTRLESDGRTIAVLVHDPAVSDLPELVRSVAAATRMALDNERLAAEVRAQLEEVRASRARIVSAGDQERRRVERDLHDGAQQRLVTLALGLQMARERVDGRDPTLASILADASRSLESALAELRSLARGLHPSVLVEDGLHAAVEALADRSPVVVGVECPEGRYAPAVESTAYFVVAEALTNVAKYAQATAATVRISEDDGVLAVEISDDGIGGADPTIGSGLRGLEDRVAAINGRLEITSEAGRGTTVKVDLPCA